MRVATAGEHGKRLEYDSQLALEMAACARLGISHSHFLGGPPVFTQADRDKAVWYEIHERTRCPSCGTRPEEWDPEQGGHDHAYTWEIHRCWGCAEKAKGDAEITRKKYDSSYTTRLVPNPKVRR